MEAKSLEFLTSLLDAPGPSGFETEPARRWRAEAEKFCDEVSSDIGGNSYGTVNPSGAVRVMLAGHVDEIGLMIVHVDDRGYCFFDTIGGWDSQVFVGQRVTILGRSGPVPGVIGKKAVHLIEQDERDKVSKTSDLWIDIGASSREQALETVRVGDPAVLGSSVLRLPNDRIASRSLDNRVGAFVVLEAARLLARQRPAAAVTAVATAQEEISYTGGGARTSATQLEAQVALVVDVTHATDHPEVKAEKHGDVKLGGGPVISRGSAINSRVFELLVETAEEEKIPYTLQAAPRFTGTDADSIFTSRSGVATGLVSVPLRYMHSPSELVSLDDLTRAAELLAAFARRVRPDTSFVPS